MFEKFLSHKDIHNILDNKFQNKMALDFIIKYLYACRKRNKKFLSQKNKGADAQKPN